MRSRFIGIVVLALAVSSACEKNSSSRNPLAPDGTPILNGIRTPYSSVNWELYLGNPSCSSGCGPSPKLIVTGGPGQFEAALVVNTNHALKAKVRFSRAGHKVKIRVTNESGRSPRIPLTEEFAAAESNLGWTLSADFYTRPEPGTYLITLRVEETGSDLPPAGVVQEVVIRVILS